MKKCMRILAIVLAFVLGMCLCGCTTKGGLHITDHKWEFSAVQDRQNGEILYASSADQATYGGVYAQAATLELACKVNKKEIVLTNRADGQKWRFDYTLQSETEDGCMYSLVMGELSASATINKTEYADNSVLYALMLSFDERTLYFYAEK